MAWQINLTGLYIPTISDTVSICRPFRLTDFPQVLKTLNYFSVNLRFADSVYRHYSRMKIILYHLLDVHIKYVLIIFETRNTFFLNSFQGTFSKSLMCNLGKLGLMTRMSLRIFSVSVSVAVNHFTTSDRINQIWNNKF